MTVGFVPRLIRRISGTASPVWLCSALLLGIGASDARADFTGYYAPGNFTLANVGGGVDGSGAPTANGDVFPSLLGLTLYGTNDGSGVPGYTDLTIAAETNGLFQFRYLFTTLDIPHTEYAGYLLGTNAGCPVAQPDCNFHLLADDPSEPGASGLISVPVTAGELIGFRAGSYDSQGGLPAVLTISDFSAPVPEPGTFQLLLIAIGGVGARVLYTKRRGARRP